MPPFSSRGGIIAEMTVHRHHGCAFKILLVQQIMGTLAKSSLEKTEMGGNPFSQIGAILCTANLLLVITLRLNLHNDDVVLLGSWHQDCRLDEQP